MDKENLIILNQMPGKFKLITPVVLLAFNRPEKTQRVFNEIKKARPDKLFIVADGPRNGTDKSKCEAVRDIINRQIDWPCQVFKNYAERNLGCKVRISSGITWVFQNVEEAIFLEDDCVPDPSFFPFCQELLEKYRNNSRVMSVSGYNMAVRDSSFKSLNSYYFSNIGLILGWASWRRAWQYYDVNISRWLDIKKSGLLHKVLNNPPVVNHYEHLFDQYYRRTVDSWDSQWFLTRWLKHGLSIVPKTNLVANIGFDAEGTHTAIDPNDPRAHVPIISMNFPLTHPDNFIVDKAADDYTFKHYMGINLLWSQHWRWWLKSCFPYLH